MDKPVQISTEGGLNSLTWETVICNPSWTFTYEGPDPKKEWEHYYRRGNTLYFRNKVLGQKFSIETESDIKIPRGKYEVDATPSEEGEAASFTYPFTSTGELDGR